MVNEQRVAMVSGLRLLTRNPRYARVCYGYSMLHLEQASTFGWAHDGDVEEYEVVSQFKLLAGVRLT